MTPFFPGLFDLRGIGFAAWTLAAFAIGALAGAAQWTVLATVVLLGSAFAVAFWLPRRARETAETGGNGQPGQPGRHESAVAAV